MIISNNQKTRDEISIKVENKDEPIKPVRKYEVSRYNDPGQHDVESIPEGWT